MSSSRERASTQPLRPGRRALCLSLLALGGCGFTPVYGPAPYGGESELWGRIRFAPPRDEEGLALVRRLEDRLGQPEAADLLMTAQIHIEEKAVGFLPDGEISRYNVLGRVEWQLARAGTGAVIATGRERSFTSYSATSTTVATTFARRDARRRLMVILADRIVTDLLARDLA